MRDSRRAAAAVSGVLVWISRPLDELVPPFTLTLPIDAAQATRFGRTAEPPRITRTDATTVDPAFGFAGDT